MIKDRHHYVDRNGSPVSIVGRTKDHPCWVFSRQGNWYVRETGQFLFYSPKTGVHSPSAFGSMKDIDLSVDSKPFGADD